MGNSNVKKLNKKKMSGPALAAMIVSIVILLAFLLSLVASTGFFFRIQAGASSQNFNVNASMMSYFTNAYYQSWYSQNYYYIYLGYFKFDPTVSFKEQYVDKDKKTSYYDYFKDAAISQVEQILKYCEAAKADSAVDFAKLESDAKAAAKAAITSLEASAKTAGYTVDAYVRANFGPNVSTGDIYDCVVLEDIASSYYTILYDRTYDAVTDAEKDAYFKEHLSTFVTAKYLTYVLTSPVAVPSLKAADYVGGEVSTAYKAAVKEATKDIKADDYEGGADGEAYKKAVEDAIAAAGIVASKYDGGEESEQYKADLEKAKADAKAENEAQKIKDKELMDKLAAATSEEEFKKIILETEFDDAFEKAFTAAIKDIDKKDAPTEEDEKAFKESIRDAVIQAVLDGKTDITEDEDDAEGEAKAAEEPDDKKEEEKEEKTPWEKAQEKLPATIIKSLTTTLTNAEKKPSYALKEDLDKWLFGGIKGQFGIEYAEGEDKNGTSAKVGETKVIDKVEDESVSTYKLSVYYVTEEAHRDETILRDVGHILIKVDEKGDYKTSEDAKKKIDEIYAELLKKATDGIISKEDFETIANEHTMDSGVFYDNVGKGQMVEEFEAWLFDAKKVGEMGFVESEYGWHIMYYGGETETAAWNFNAHSYVTNEKIDTWFKGLPYQITVNEAIFNSIIG